MSEETDNPAGRLFKVIHTIQSGQPNDEMRAILGRVLYTNQTDDIALVQGWAAVLDLPGQIRRDMALIDPSPRPVDRLDEIEK